MAKFPGMEFTLYQQTPAGRQAVAVRQVIPCDFCDGPVWLPDGALEHLLVCPEAPPSVLRVAQATVALLQATAQAARKEAAHELGFAVADDLIERQPGGLVIPKLPGIAERFYTAWVQEQWGKGKDAQPPEVLHEIATAAISRHQQRQRQPA